MKLKIFQSVKNPFHYLRVETLSSSTAVDPIDCTFLCVREPNCLSLNIAAYPDLEGFYQCELLATDKYTAKSKFQANAAFHHYSANVTTDRRQFILFYLFYFSLFFCFYLHICVLVRTSGHMIVM